MGIDFRPQNGRLFGLGINGPADNGTLYRIDPQTGAATVIGAAGSITGAFPDVPTTSGFGFDFNPAVDLIRVVTSNGLNFAVNPNTGVVAAVQTNINGSGVTGVSATAYTNNFGQTTGVGNPTTQYTLDDVTDTLYIQNPPASGTQTTPMPVTVGGSPLNFSAVNGFDISGGVSSALPAGTPVTSGFGYAVLTVVARPASTIST